MIKLAKSPSPKVLARNAGTWSANLLGAVTKGPAPQHLWDNYRRPSIKRALVSETKQKCAYCESAISHAAYNHIEHIIPKSSRPDLCYDWSNLTLSCPVCNQRKSSKYDPNCTFLNPYQDNPDDFLVAIGPGISHKGGQLRGEITHTRLELNRVDLLSKRWERLETVKTLVERWEVEANPKLRLALRDQCLMEIEPHKEYCFVVAAYLACRGVI